MQNSASRSYKFDPYEWSAGVRVNKNAIGSSFSIYVFVTPPEISGDPLVGEDPIDWIKSKYYAGDVAVFTGGYGSSTSSGKKGGEIIEGFVSLNDKLKEFTKVVEPVDAVKRHLRNHLLWKAAKPGQGGDKEIELSKLDKLEVTVYSAKLKGVRGDLPIPEYEDAVEHPEVTKGKEGGSKD